MKLDDAPHKYSDSRPTVGARTELRVEHQPDRPGASARTENLVTYTLTLHELDAHTATFQLIGPSVKPEGGISLSIPFDKWVAETGRSVHITIALTRERHA